MKGSAAKEKKTRKPLSAKAYALRLLSFRSRSKKEISERLQEKGFSPKEIEDALEYLEDAGFLKDSLLAERLLQYAIEKKHLGRRGIKMLLLRRGLDKELIDKTLSGIADEAEQEAALRFTEKKLKTLGNYPKATIKQKLYRALERRGFSRNIINAAMTSAF